jgi:dTDP-4-dehydrorhamnose reductase
MNILVLGSRGQVGWELTRSLLPLGRVTALGREELDIGDVDALRHTVRASQPDLIVNAAAYTAVDKAETETEAAFSINAVAAGILAEEAKNCKALLIHYSTDYVFDGLAIRPYCETDSTNPQSVYGRSKLAGEEAIAAIGGDHLILRTSWVYGARGHNFLRAILRLAHERANLRIVADQIGAPTWSRWIADATAQIARQALQAQVENRFNSEVYHLTCAGETSWHGFASAIIEEYRNISSAGKLAVQNIEPITTAEYPLPAKRPANSRLDCSKLSADYGIAAPDWRQALRLCMEDVAVSN